MFLIPVSIGHICSYVEFSLLVFCFSPILLHLTFITGPHQMRILFLMLSSQWFGDTNSRAKGQESLACCGPWGRRELDTTEPLNSNNDMSTRYLSLLVQSFTEKALKSLFSKQEYWGGLPFLSPFYFLVPRKGTDRRQSINVCWR